MEVSMDFLIPLTMAIVSVYLLFKFLTQSYDYWEKQNVKTVTTWPVLGSTNFHKPLHEAELDQFNKYGSIYGRFDGPLPVLSVAVPELLRKILVKDFSIFQNHRILKFDDPIMDNILFALEGKDWKRVRNIISPCFTSAKLRKMLPLVEDCSDIITRKIEESVDSRGVLCQRIFSEFVLSVIAKCAFGVKIEKRQELIIEKAEEMLSCWFNWRTIVVLLCPWVMKPLRISLLNPKTTSYYRDVINEIVKQRRNSNEVWSDFLQSVLDNCDQNNNSDSSKNGNDAQVSTTDDASKRLGLSEDEAVAQCVTLFMAGFDPTTSLLSYALYHMAIFPHYQMRMFDEIQEVLSQNQNVLTHESLSQLKFMDAVLSETLRLCPPLVRADRRAGEDYVLGDTGIVIGKDMLVSIPIYAMHRNPEWFPNPDTFDPERFLSPDTEPAQYTYLPFGCGPRLCLGKRFVELSTKVCLVKLIQKFRISTTNSTKIPLKIKELRGTLRVEDVYLKFVSRSADSSAY